MCETSGTADPLLLVHEAGAIADELLGRLAPEALVKALDLGSPRGFDRAVALLAAKLRRPSGLRTWTQCAPPWASSMWTGPDHGCPAAQAYRRGPGCRTAGDRHHSRPDPGPLGTRQSRSCGDPDRGATVPGARHRGRPQRPGPPGGPTRGAVPG